MGKSTPRLEYMAPEELSEIIYWRVSDEYLEFEESDALKEQLKVFRNTFDITPENFFSIARIFFRTTHLEDTVDKKTLLFLAKRANILTYLYVRFAYNKNFRVCNSENIEKLINSIYPLKNDPDWLFF